MNDPLPCGLASRAPANFVDMVPASKVIASHVHGSFLKGRGVFTGEQQMDRRAQSHTGANLLWLVAAIAQIGKQQQQLLRWAWPLIHSSNTYIFLASATCQTLF